jgi:hypothetical protein
MEIGFPASGISKIPALFGFTSMARFVASLYGGTGKNACATKQLFFADVIHDSHGDAVVSLRVGRLIWIVRECGSLVIELEQAYRPVGLESPLHSASPSPGESAACGRSLWKSGIQGKREAIVSAAKQNLPVGNKPVPMSQGIDTGTDHEGINLRVAIEA